MAPGKELQVLDTCSWDGCPWGLRLLSPSAVSETEDRACRKWRRKCFLCSWQRLVFEVLELSYWGTWNPEAQVP